MSNSHLYDNNGQDGKHVKSPGCLFYGLLIDRDNEAETKEGEHDDNVGGDVQLVYIGWEPGKYMRMGCILGKETYRQLPLLL